MGKYILKRILIAVPAGIYSAVKQYSKGDYAVVVLISNLITDILYALVDPTIQLG